MYTYRLGGVAGVPSFVPPGHGLVYLAALCLARSRVFARHERVLVAATVVGAVQAAEAIKLLVGEAGGTAGKMLAFDLWGGAWRIVDLAPLAREGCPTCRGGDYPWLEGRLGGVDAGTYEEGGRRYDVRVRLEESQRQNRDQLQLIQIRSESGQLIDLAEYI